VRFQVKPRGEIFVDGVSKGRVPPLQEIEIPAGHHVIQLRNPGSPVFEQALDLAPGEKRVIIHTFPRPAEVPKPKPDFWRDFKKRFS
jgi:eukaryotic-like serine/threonine-protein kinase